MHERNVIKDGDAKPFQITTCCRFKEIFVIGAENIRFADDCRLHY